MTPAPDPALNTPPELASDLALDVLVLGAGPAGATTALQLAGHCRVGLLGRAPAAGPAIGESLPAAARVLLGDLGVWPAFAAQQHRPAYTRVSLWGGPEASYRDALQDPHGHGWHLDRPRFDTLLRDAALQRGAQPLWPAELRRLHHTPGQHTPWDCSVQQGNRLRRVRSRLLVDASGRAARVVRQAGMAISRQDRLICLHTWLPAGPQAMALPGATVIEAGPAGWWYSADLPAGGCVLALHTDSDLAAAHSCRTAQDLLALARQTQLISQRCPAVSSPLDDAPALRIAPAHSQWAGQAAGTDWLAVGDAALAFDPLASQGLMNCLYTGLHAALAARRHLDGDTQALPAWAAHTRDITQAYAGNLSRYYALEQRWPDAPFWQRRHSTTPRQASAA